MAIDVFLLIRYIFIFAGSWSILQTRHIPRVQTVLVTVGAVWDGTYIQPIKKCTSRQQLFFSRQEGCAVASIRTSVPLCTYLMHSVPSGVMTFAQIWSHLAV